ncbi:hypothetical protein Salmuc_01359 [Salipiger mucosus DSM 16094]|uniref:Uncharacterized protein n=2 Tax=Salipiger mucosus TaxID=263378 RepID=S9QTU0_9RHOB|nr:hypothetical protein Salmuc_01359 [Salipiger mucosus DSM 16094]
MPGAEKTYGYYAVQWWTESSDVLLSGRDDLETLHAKVGGELVDFDAKSVLEASQEKGWDGLAPVGAQFSRKLAVLVFDL